jgi:hypothetical protein
VPVRKAVHFRQSISKYESLDINSVLKQHMSNSSRRHRCPVIKYNRDQEEILYTAMDMGDPV